MVAVIAEASRFKVVPAKALSKFIKLHWWTQFWLRSKLAFVCLFVSLLFGMESFVTPVHLSLKAMQIQGKLKIKCLCCSTQFTFDVTDHTAPLCRNEGLTVFRGLSNCVHQLDAFKCFMCTALLT